MCKTNILIVDDAQHAAILAALRIYQQSGASADAAIEDIATQGGAFEALGTVDIDALCESINQASPAKEALLDALVANGYEFGDFVTAFAEDEESSAYVKAARNQVAYKEGSLEVDPSSVVSMSEGGAYVMGWIWVDEPYSVSLEQLATCFDDKEIAPPLSAYAAWLKETLANFSDEIDDIEDESVEGCEAKEILWEHDGKKYSFLPSEALDELLDEAIEKELLGEDEAHRVEGFIEQFSDKLDRALRSVNLAV